MPTGAGKQDEYHDHWQAREAVWASWGDQDANDKKMAETKDRRDAARKVHEAKQMSKHDKLAVRNLGNTSIPVMVKLLGDGLCADQGEGGIETSDGVYYKRAELQHLQYYYDKSYAFDPKNIGVIFDESRVRIDGRVHVVKSVDHGKYTLGGRESTITQWKLLENRCD
ncbi:unnamed protein product [Pylaiella littoralis]